MNYEDARIIIDEQLGQQRFDAPEGYRAARARYCEYLDGYRGRTGIADSCREGNDRILMKRTKE